MHALNARRRRAAFIGTVGLTRVISHTCVNKGFNSTAMVLAGTRNVALPFEWPRVNVSSLIGPDSSANRTARSVEL